MQFTGVLSKFCAGEINLSIKLDLNGFVYCNTVTVPQLHINMKKYACLEKSDHNSGGHKMWICPHIYPMLGELRKRRGM